MTRTGGRYWIALGTMFSVLLVDLFAEIEWDISVLDHVPVEKEEWKDERVRCGRGAKMQDRLVVFTHLICLFMVIPSRIKKYMTRMGQ